jgi:muramidase (phage lysozyme)
MMDMGRYEQVCYWWDSEDRQYNLLTIWDYSPEDLDLGYYEDYELISVEVLESETGAPCIEHLLDKHGDIWKSIENDFDRTQATYIDSRDYDDYDYYVDEVY